MEPLKFGNITLPHKAVFGPMAGFTDAPCRRLMAEHGAGFTVSEMVSSRALVYGDHKTVSLLKAEPNGAPYGVQIFGEVPESMPSLVANVTIAATTIMGYGAMAGIIGGGGLGKIAINYGYYRFNVVLEFFATALLVVLVQILQTVGTKLAIKCDKRIQK